MTNIPDWSSYRAESRKWLTNGYGWSLAAAVCAFGNHAMGVGVRLPNQDATAIARGNAFVATADNPSAIYYNPAGITQLEGQNFQIGSLFHLGIYGDYKGPGGERIENQAEVLAVPTLQYTISTKRWPISFGLGIYEPFGLSVKWPKDAPFSSGGYQGKLTYITVNPVVAWEICPTLSISAGPTFNYSQIDLRQSIAGLPIPGAEFRFKGDDWGYGLTAGVLWKPHDQWAVGASYRSASKSEYDGRATTVPSPPLPGRASTSSDFEFPQIIMGGVSYRPSTNWNFEVSIDWADWTSFDKLAVDGFPAQRLDWHSSFMYGAGATRFLGKGYFVSLGYFFSEESTSERFFTPLVADTDLHVASFGGGRKSEHWSWALAVQMIAGDWRKVDGAANPSVNGSYRLFMPTVSFTVGYHF